MRKPPSRARRHRGWDPSSGRGWRALALVLQGLDALPDRHAALGVLPQTCTGPTPCADVRDSSSPSARARCRTGPGATFSSVWVGSSGASNRIFESRNNNRFGRHSLTAPFGGRSGRVPASKTRCITASGVQHGARRFDPRFCASQMTSSGARFKTAKMPLRPAESTTKTSTKNPSAKDPHHARRSAKGPFPRRIRRSERQILGHSRLSR